MEPTIRKQTLIVVPSTGTAGCSPRLEPPEVARAKETKS
jgi:hypothetical protein